MIRLLLVLLALIGIPLNASAQGWLTPYPSLFKSFTYFECLDNAEGGTAPINVVAALQVTTDTSIGELLINAVALGYESGTGHAPHETVLLRFDGYDSSGLSMAMQRVRYFGDEIECWKTGFTANPQLLFIRTFASTFCGPKLDDEKSWLKFRLPNPTTYRLELSRGRRGKVPAELEFKVINSKLHTTLLGPMFVQPSAPTK